MRWTIGRSTSALPGATVEASTILCDSLLRALVSTEVHQELKREIGR